MNYEKLREALFSNYYPCPGGHRLDGGRGSWEEYPEEMMDLLGYPECWSYDTMRERHPGEWRHLRKMMALNWIESQRCQQQIEVYVEREGDYGEYAYLVADGPCVEALGLDEDDYSACFWEQVWERRRLRKFWPDESTHQYRLQQFIRREEARAL